MLTFHEQLYHQILSATNNMVFYRQYRNELCHMLELELILRFFDAWEHLTDKHLAYQASRGTLNGNTVQMSLKHPQHNLQQSLCKSNVLPTNNRLGTVTKYVASTSKQQLKFNYLLSWHKIKKLHLHSAPKGANYDRTKSWRHFMRMSVCSGFPTETLT